LAYISSWGCSKCSIDLRIILLQSLVQGLCVVVEKREIERTKEVPAVQKKILLLKQKKEQKKKRERRKKWVFMLLF
jgi:hypothetical protein